MKVTREYTLDNLDNQTAFGVVKINVIDSVETFGDDKVVISISNEKDDFAFSLLHTEWEALVKQLNKDLL